MSSENEYLTKLQLCKQLKINESTFNRLYAKELIPPPDERGEWNRKLWLSSRIPALRLMIDENVKSNRKHKTDGYGGRYQ